MLRTLSLVLMLAAPAFAQEVEVPVFAFPDSAYRIGDVLIVGNDLTKRYVIEQEMGLKRDSLLTHAAASYDLNRIYGLKLFTKVTFDAAPVSDDVATLIVTVQERWYFYPFPVLGIKDRDFSRLYYGAGVVHNNVGGRNTQAFASFAAGYDPYVMLNYVNPLVDIERRIFFSARAYYTEQRNRSLVAKAGAPNFDEHRAGGIVTLGKRYSLFSLVSVSLEYLNIHVSDDRAGRTLSPTGRDEFYSLHTGYVYDTRDLREYPAEGTFASFSVSKHGLLEETVDYQRVNVDLRRYVPLSGGSTVAGRAFTSLAGGGRIPNYGHVFFGYAERIRGHFNEIEEGEQIAGTTAELHVPLVSPRYLRLGFMPVEEFRDLRYALYAAAFADAGAVWYRDEPLALNTVRSGYGLGLHFHLAYSAVARFEFGFPWGRPLSEGQIILDLGAAL
ncbi:MAG: BamA/TamA family outer membrane protein [Bacteroidetes bacterium]|nr:MAG: BamA/TamA family outer membrane protein [Bacteroidota bacterium]